MGNIGHCKHGEFELIKGCSKCIAEFMNIGKTEKTNQIVKVQYVSETTGEMSAREYTYYSADRLEVGDLVIVPVRDTTGKAKVSAVDVLESEIQAFKDKVKTIPASSVVKQEIDHSIDELEEGLNSEGLTLLPDPMVTLQEELRLSSYHGEVVPETTTLTLIKPEANAEVMAFYHQALSLKAFAEARVITCNDDLKPANEDLILIRKVKKSMEERRKDYLKPFQDHVKETNDAFKTLMEPIEQADKINAGKMLAFEAEQRRKRQEAEAIENERLALARREEELTGEHTVDLTPVEKPEAVPEIVRTSMGMTGARDNWKWEVTDINLVPREYLMVNAGMLTPIVKASKGKIVIPGVRVYNEPIMAYRS